MARIVENLNQGREGWSAVIRCVRSTRSSEGCYSLIRIFKSDIRLDHNYHDGETFSVVCPVCGETIFFEWQITKVLEEIRREHNNQG